jgi:hypothetical protein
MRATPGGGPGIFSRFSPPGPHHIILAFPAQSLLGESKLVSFPEGQPMVNYIVLYKIRKRVKRILKEKISDGELATTKTSCLGCLADDISWEIYYLMKEKEEEGG